MRAEKTELAKMREETLPTEWDYYEKAAGQCGGSQRKQGYSTLLVEVGGNIVV